MGRYPYTDPHMGSPIVSKWGVKMIAVPLPRVACHCQAHASANRPGLVIVVHHNAWPRNVHFTLTKMTTVDQTQLTPSCFGYDKAALSSA
eukprot:COSAG05_NODE_12971_length_446_cov_1.187320_1_plen_89_part_10